MGNDLVERLRKGCILAQDGLGGVNMKVTDELCNEAAARIEALEGALKPMVEMAAEHADVSADFEHCTYPIKLHITVGDLRRAARVYANKGEPT